MKNKENKLSISLRQLMYIPMLIALITLLLFKYQSSLEQRLDNLQNQIDKLEVELEELRNSQHEIKSNSRNIGS